MIKMQIYNKSKNIILSKNIGKPDSIIGNMLGLMFKEKSQVDVDGLYLKPCNSIHTFFCKFALDVYFLSHEKKVIRIIKALQPWRMTRLYFSSSAVIEVKSDAISGIELGDQLEVTCLS